MQKVLRKRILRDLKENLFRYLALGGIIVLCMYLIISLIGNISVGRDHGGLDISLIRGNHGDRIISAGRRGETTGTHRQDHTQGQQNSQDFSHERNSSLKRIRIFFSIPYPEKTKKMRCIMTAGYISSVVICRQRERRL